jgi:hypothetical protein
MSIELTGNLDLTIFKNKRLHRVREVDIEISGIIVLELDVVVAVLVLDDFFAEFAPWREVHPCGVRYQQLIGSRSLPVVKLLEGSVRGVDCFLC